MKAYQSAQLVKSLKEKGWIEHQGVVYNPKKASELGLDTPLPKKSRRKVNRTGWIDDTRNSKETTDPFIKFVSDRLNIEVWSEFHFLKDRGYRLDYAIPVVDGKEVKVAIEQEGGIWMKKSGHNTGKGIKRDMDKSTQCALNGWKLIRREPNEMLTEETIELIKKALRKSH